MKNKTLIKLLTTKFPGLNVAAASEFDDNSGEGIWLKNLGSYASDDFDKAWDSGLIEREVKAPNSTNYMPVKILINDCIEKAGYYYEPYDSGTMMAYPK